MKYFQIILLIIVFLSSCIVKNPINGKKQIKFQVVSLLDNTPIDSILCQLKECHLIAHNPVAEAYTDKNGECYIYYDFEYENYIDYTTILDKDENQLVSKNFQGKLKYYSIVDEKTNFVDLARKNEFEVKMVLLPLGTLRLVFEKKDIEYERMIIEFYNKDKKVKEISMGNLTDSIDLYLTALDTLVYFCKLTKNDVVLYSRTSNCKLDSFSTQRKEIKF